MNEAALWSETLLDRAQERDHVVVRLSLDLLCAFKVIAGVANNFHRIGGDDAFVRPALADQDLNPQPGIQLVLFGPDRGHLRPRVAFDHRRPRE